MATFLPDALNDESLASVVARYIDERPWCATTSVIKNVFGYLAYASVLGQALGHVAAETHHCWGLSAEEIAENLTCFPYFAALSDQRRAEGLLNRMVEPRSLRKGRPMVSPRFGGSRGMRFCKSCFSSDRREGLPLYWRRTHQLPGVVLCPWHEESLWEIIDSRSHCCGFFPPKDWSKFNAHEIDLKLGKMEKLSCLEMSTLSTLLLRNRITVFPHDVRQSFLRSVKMRSPYFAGERSLACIGRLARLCFGFEFLYWMHVVKDRHSTEWQVAVYLIQNARPALPALVILAALENIIRKQPEILNDRYYQDIYSNPMMRRSRLVG